MFEGSRKNNQNPFKKGEINTHRQASSSNETWILTKRLKGVNKCSLPHKVNWLFSLGSYAQNETKMLDSFHAFIQSAQIK